MVSVVITDDDHDTVETLAGHLEARGIKVAGKAYDGNEATQLYAELKPDLILVDLMMPNYDGHYAIEKIKQDDPFAKIVVVSAYLDKNFPANKVSAVFSKPYDADELANKIKQLAK